MDKIDSEEVQDTSLYEIMVILSPDLGEEKTKKELDEVRELITSNGGKITFEDIWGVREFAYTIKKYDEGYYAVINFELVPKKLKELETPLNLSQKVLRYLVTKAPKNYTPITLEEYQEMAKKEDVEAEKAKNESKKGLPRPAPKTIESKKVEPKVEAKKEKPKSEEVKEESKSEEVKEEPKEAVPAKEKAEDAKLDEVDEKLKSIINDPDITL